MPAADTRYMLFQAGPSNMLEIDSKNEAFLFVTFCRHRWYALTKQILLSISC